MPVVTLPLTFSNSFWTQDYRRGLETVFRKIEQGTAENGELVNFIRARVAAERSIATTLTNPALTGQRGTGFEADDGASLLPAFRGLQRESIAQGEAHAAVAKDLETLVVDPFDDWSAAHKERVLESRKRVLDNWLKSYEQSSSAVEKLKYNYITKTRYADEAEDDAKFAPTTELGDKFTGTASPTRSAVGRSGTVSERISQRLRERMGSPEAAKLPEVKEDVTEDPTEEKYTAEEKGKSKEVLPPLQTTPPTPPAKAMNVPLTPVAPNQQAPMLLAGIALLPSAVTALLVRARSELPLRSVNVPIIGEYEDCFTGEDLTKWLRENVEAFGGSLDRAEQAARELGDRYGMLKRVGAFGNKFESSKSAFYQFRGKAFHVEEEDDMSEASVQSPTFSLAADTIMKRSSTITSYITTALGGVTNEPRLVKLRTEAEKADQAYVDAVRTLDRQRLVLEERIEETLKTLHWWELERLRAVKTVLLQYQGTIANLPSALQASFDRSAVLLASYQPDMDIVALIERYRTGPFRPVAQVYESISHQGPGRVCFGIDLGNWAGEGGWNALRTGTNEHKEQPKVPGVLSGLLAGLDVAYKQLPSDAERRKTWIYEVPLTSVHRLRESLNSISPNDSPPLELLAIYDAPVLASAVKLWLLELNPPLGSWEAWDDVRRIYPSVGAHYKAEGKVDELKQVLAHLPKVYIHCLEVILLHLKNLIDTTKAEEPDDVYITKLALSVGRAILRPKYESEITVQDRHPTLFFIDLINHYADIVPPVIARKQRESGARQIPLRKRTAPIDQRLSRSSMTGLEDPRKLLEAQMNIRAARSRPPSPEPVLPLVATVPATEETPSIQESASVQPTAPPHEADGQQDVPSSLPTDEDGVAPPRPLFEEPLPSPTMDHPSELAMPRAAPLDDEPITNSPSKLTRNSSGDATRVRRSTRGPRLPPLPPISGRRGGAPSGELPPPHEPAHPHIPVDARDYVPRRKGGRAAAGLFAKRDNLATRSMGSGDEDEVVGKYDTSNAAVDEGSS